jgi:hypothetical protein
VQWISLKRAETVHQYIHSPPTHARRPIIGGHGLIVTHANTHKHKSTMSLSAASDPPPPSLSKYPVGTVLRKHFPGHGWFKGWIDSSNAYYYRIVYEDGDAEEMDESEVAQYLGQRRRQGRPHKGGSSGVTTTLPPQPNKKARTAVTTTTTTSTSAKTRSGWKRTDLLWTSQGLDPRHFAKQNFTVAALDAATTERLADFFLFMYERQMIWVRRSSGQAPPWTELPPFQDFCFCNVYRELDRGTTFLHAHILDLWEAQQSSGTPSERDWTFAVLWAAYTYRLMNRVSTFQAVGFPSINNVKAFLEQCQNLLDEGQAIFTGVHQTNGWAKYQLWLKQMSAKHAQPMAKVVDDLLQATTVAACQKILQQLPGVSNFMSWQLWCDLRESRCLMGVTSDVTTYCTLGPGAKSKCVSTCGAVALLTVGTLHVPLFSNAHHSLFAEYVCRGTRLDLWTNRQGE